MTVINKKVQAMKHSELMLSIIMTLLIPGVAMADQSLHGSASYSQMELIAQKEYNAALGKMSRSYDNLSLGLTTADIKRLDEAQIKWSGFSTAECRFTTHFAQAGSLGKVMYQDCLTTMTEDRASVLQLEARRDFTHDPTLAWEDVMPF